MKQIVFALLCLPFFAVAQKEKSGKNTLKGSISSAILDNYHVMFERQIGKKNSLSIGYRYQPKGVIPLKNSIENMIGNPNVNVGDFKLGNTALTAEWRFYSKNMRGFYVAPYVRKADFDMSVPVKFQPSGGAERTAIFDGKISSFSGGLMIGTQFPLAEWLYIDFWIVGLHYGTSDGNLNAQIALNSNEQQELKRTLDDVDIPFVKLESTVNANGAVVNSKGPWGGIRGLGINLAIRF